MTTTQDAVRAISGGGGYPGAAKGALNASAPAQTALNGGSVAGRRAPFKLSREKIALIHVARRDLQLDDDIYRSVLREVAGVGSSAELSLSGFDAVMSRFERLGFKSRTAQAGDMAGASGDARQLGDRPGWATSAQLDYIRNLWVQWLGRDDEAALARWIENKYHVSALRFLDVVAAQKAIEGLKCMAKRRGAAARRAKGA